MTIRDDITIDWFSSPRVLTVAAPSTEITIQDLHDTCRHFENLSEGMFHDYLIDSAGKEPLGGVVYVGITSTLNNAVLSFEARGGPDWVLCTISGGNLVAVDDVGGELDPRLPTAYVSCDRTASSSATLQEQDSIQYSSFNGGVSVDITSSYTGTTFPVGTPLQPVNNMTDALLIAAERGFTTFFIYGDITLDSGIDYQERIFIGESMTKSVITISSAANVTSCEFYDAEITGTLDGENVLDNCLVKNITYVNGFIKECVLGTGTIVLGGSNEAHFLDCWSGVVGTTAPIIDMGGSGQNLGLRNYNGDLKIKNSTGANEIKIDLNSGLIELDSTITAGNIVIRGIGQVIDNTGGTTTVDQDNLMSKETITEISWDTIHIDVTNGQSGTTFPLGTAGFPVDNLDDARTIALERGIEKFYFKGALTMNYDFEGYVFDSPEAFNNSINTNGYSITGSKFNRVYIYGNGTGLFSALECVIGAWTNLSAITDKCVFSDDISIEAGQSLYAYACSSFINITIDLNNTGSVIFNNGSGQLSFANATNAACYIKITGDNIISILPSCTAGICIVSGVGSFTDGGSMDTVLDLLISSTDISSDFNYIKKTINNKKTLSKSGSTWSLIIYDDDDTTPILSKELKDKDGNDIDDITAGVLAQELKTSV